MALLIAASAAGQVPGDTIPFKQTPQGSLDLLLTRPSGWAPSDARPAIVIFSGSAWINPSRNQFARHAAYLAGRGIVAIRADHRVSRVHQTEPDAAVEDARSAVRWVRAHAGELGIDPHRIVVAGASSGGQLAACAARCEMAAPAGEDPAVSARPDALVLFNPVVDMPDFIGRPEVRDAIFEGFPGLLGDPALQARISPLAHVDSLSPPTLQLYGSDDFLIVAGRRYGRALEELGVRSELFVAEGVGHGFFNRSPWFERTLFRVDQFLASLGYLSGPPTIELP